MPKVLGPRWSRVRVATRLGLAILVGCGAPEENLPAEILAVEVLRDMAPRLFPVPRPVLLSIARRVPPRWAYPAEPGTWHRARFVVPSDGALEVEFAVGVPESSGPAGRWHFEATVDGGRVFERTLDPDTTRSGRRWQSTRLDLARHAGREVEVALRADPLDRVGRGRPAWGRTELVRVHRKARSRSAPDAPNVLVVLVDTLRADALGLHGARPSPSPVADTLATQGLVFEDVMAPAPWTVPSVATIFTGRHPREHGVTLSDHGQEGADAYLATSIPTLAAIAQRAGITTIGFSANPLVGPDTGLAAGFEHFSTPQAKYGTRRWAPGTELNRRFLTWAARRRDLRFLAYVHYMEVHAPYAPEGEPPPPHADSMVQMGHAGTIGHRMLAGEPPPTAADAAHLRHLYDLAVGVFDRALGELLGGLDDLGLRDRTIVVVTADHGEEFLEHGHLAHGKQLFDESLRVPLVMAGPGVPIGRRAEPVSLVDLLPTIAGRLGAEIPLGVAGMDLLAPNSSGVRAAYGEVRRALCFGDPESPLVMVREPPWKLLWAPDLDRVALFHLPDDPGERRDRGATEPQGARLRAAARAYWRRSATVEAPPMAPGVPEKLRALGYVD